MEWENYIQSLESHLSNPSDTNLLGPSSVQKSTMKWDVTERIKAEVVGKGVPESFGGLASHTSAREVALLVHVLT